MCDSLKRAIGLYRACTFSDRAAQVTALQMLASLKAATGDLDKITRVVKISGFISSTNDFTAQPQVMNGCSDFLCGVFGIDVGRHARYLPKLFCCRFSSQRAASLSLLLFIVYLCAARRSGSMSCRWAWRLKSRAFLKSLRNAVVAPLSRPRAFCFRSFFFHSLFHSIGQKLPAIAFCTL